MNWDIDFATKKDIILYFYIFVILLSAAHVSFIFYCMFSIGLCYSPYIKKHGSGVVENWKLDFPVLFLILSRSRYIHCVLQGHIKSYFLPFII